MTDLTATDIPPIALMASNTFQGGTESGLVGMRKPPTV
jgi:hypothetical protein